MSKSALPSTANAFEITISQVVADLKNHNGPRDNDGKPIPLGVDNIPVPIPQLWDATACPEELLPWLAWAMSVDEWDNNWPEQVKRQVVRDSVRVHRHKGTIGSLKRSLANVDLPIEVTEWFETKDQQPYTFHLNVDANARGMGKEAYTQIDRIIEDTKNARSHLTKATVNLKTKSTLKVGVSLVSGERTCVFPRQLDVLTHHSPAISFTSGEYSVVTTSVFPMN